MFFYNYWNICSEFPSHILLWYGNQPFYSLKEKFLRHYYDVKISLPELMNIGKFSNRPQYS